MRSREAIETIREEDEEKVKKKTEEKKKLLREAHKTEDSILAGDLGLHHTVSEFLVSGRSGKWSTLVIIYNAVQESDK
ncbi:hypothetical protein Tco_0253041 [Tanacetum coccineum]